MNKKTKKIIVWLGIGLAVVAIASGVIANMMLEKQMQLITLEAGQEYVIDETYGDKERTTNLSIELQDKGNLHMEVYDSKREQLEQKDISDTFCGKYHTKGDMTIRLKSESELQVRVTKEYRFSLW